MLKIDAWCDSCDTEFSVDLVNTELVAKYCPVCGAIVDDIETINLDEDFMEEDWEEQMWLYEGKEFTSEMIGDYIGFVYIITIKSTGKKYLGKKLFMSTRRLAPLKGKTRKRKVVKESDWMTYYGSSEEVKMIVEEMGASNFDREIIHLCDKKGEMSYIEAKLQFDYGVLLSDDWYNGIVNCKIHKSHVKGLREKFGPDEELRFRQPWHNRP